MGVNKSYYPRWLYIMEDIEKVVAVALAVIGGGAIAYGLYKLLNQNKLHYNCPKCGWIFQGKPQSCPHCRVPFKW